MPTAVPPIRDHIPEAIVLIFDVTFYEIRQPPFLATVAVCPEVVVHLHAADSLSASIRRESP